MPFESIEDFRGRATEDDYKSLENYIKKQPNRQKAFPNKDYSFSYSAAAAELRAHGYLMETRTKTTASAEPDEEDDIMRADESKCVDCQRCVTMCPTRAHQRHYLRPLPSSRSGQ